MSNLILSTLAMMGLTFVIGFFVAAVIKIIANWADLLDFYHCHQKEILNLKKEHINTSYIEISPFKGKFFHNPHRKLTHKINETISNLKPKKRITA